MLHAMSEGTLTARGVAGERAEEVVHFPERDAGLEANRGELMPVEPDGEVAEKGVAGIGGDAVNDQVAVSDAEGQRAPCRDQRLQPVHETLGGMPELGMPVRVHRAVVEHDRELDEEVGQLAGQDGGLPARAGPRVCSGLARRGEVWLTL